MEWRMTSRCSRRRCTGPCEWVWLNRWVGSQKVKEEGLASEVVLRVDLRCVGVRIIDI